MPPDGERTSRLRALPSVQRLLESAQAQALTRTVPRPVVVAALRLALDEARVGVRSAGGEPPAASALVARAGELLARRRGAGVVRVINATGVVLHTNLGRAPLPAVAAEAMSAAAHGYGALEFDLADGGRGSRLQAVEPRLIKLLGAQAALAVNNAAAAVLLALSALAAGGEVVVSRGELVEIGGGFRIPEVIAQGGARLVEVGATNKTRIQDYERALTERSRVLLKVHPSNFRMTGFVEETSIRELADLAAPRGLHVVHDLGSGALVDLARFGRPSEPTPQASLQAGADVVAFSGDKLMGGPQAGLVVGRAAPIERMRSHPLMRALRLDKVTLSGLAAVLSLYEEPSSLPDHLPVLRMLAQTLDGVEARASRVLAALGDRPQARPGASGARIGGGASPDTVLASACIILTPERGSCEGIAAALRAAGRPVVGRIAGGAVVLDLFTVEDEEEADLAAAIHSALLLADGSTP